MRISDNVANYILDLLNEDGIAEIQRNILAETLGCVPSQINYVITSRFTPEHGYIVESRRGGGGYIRITRRNLSKADGIMHIVNSIGDKLDAGSLRAMLENMGQTGIISAKEIALINAATSDKTLSKLERDMRDSVRSEIFKRMLLICE